MGGFGGQLAVRGEGTEHDDMGVRRACVLSFGGGRGQLAVSRAG
jgi:hypothetical protein